MMCFRIKLEMKEDGFHDDVECVKFLLAGMLESAVCQTIWPMGRQVGVVVVGGF